MNRLNTQWSRLRLQGQKALVTFITVGDPNLETTRNLLSVLDQEKVDLIELGIPFSDPMADGPVIQKASERALAQGVTLSNILELVQGERARIQAPILLMGYYNPILSYGLKSFAQDAARSGVDAVLVVDLPPEESDELDSELLKNNIDLIYLLSPTSDASRIRIVAQKARGFIYFVSMTGVTGGKLQSDQEIKKKISEIRKYSDLPIALGFGISNAEDTRRLSALADGIVVGSALVRLIEEHAGKPELKSEVQIFVKELKEAVSS